MKSYLVLLLILLNFFCIQIFAQTSHTKLPNFLYGTWEIYKYLKNGGTLLKPKEVQNYIGKKINFRKDSFTYDNPTLFFNESCKLEKYQFETIIPKQNYVDERLRGTLYWEDLEGSQKNRVQFVKVYCSKNADYYFEITDTKELSIYYDGYHFFLRKVIN
jgi:hypothetical protein